MDEYGDPLSHHYTTVPGLAVTPVGLRMLWRDGKVWKPYFTVEGGVVGYTQKALSPDGTYLNFTLQTGVGAEPRLTHAWEIRLGAGDFHFSNASAETRDIALSRFRLLEPRLEQNRSSRRRGSSLSDGATVFGCYAK